MIPLFLKKAIKKARKEKEEVNLYCEVCKMGINKMYIHIKAIAIKKEFLRQHNHKTGILKIIINFIKEVNYVRKIRRS